MVQNASFTYNKLTKSNYRLTTASHTKLAVNKMKMK